MGDLRFLRRRLEARRTQPPQEPLPGLSWVPEGRILDLEAARAKRERR